METHQYRVDPRMIPPVILSMGFSVFLIFLEGFSQRGFLLILLLSPFFYLGAEILARKIVFDSQGATVAKFLRSTRLQWSDLTSLDAIRSGNKLFVILQGRGARPVVITNTIAPFRDLVDKLLEFVPPDKVAPAAKEILSNQPPKHGPLLHAWITCVVITALVVGKLLGYD